MPGKILEIDPSLVEPIEGTAPGALNGIREIDPALVEPLESVDRKQEAPETETGTTGLVGETVRQLGAGTAQTFSGVGFGLEAAGKLIDDYYRDFKGPRIPFVDAGMEGAGKALRSTGREAMDYWDRTAEKLPQSADIQGNITEKPALLANPKWWASNVANMTPSLLASVMVSLAAGPVGPVVGGAAGGLMEGAGTRGEALRRGMSGDEATDKGVKMTVASAILNGLSLNNMINRGARSRLWKFITSGGMESATEYAEEPAEGLILGEPIDQFMQRLEGGLNVVPPTFLTGGIAGHGAKSLAGEKKAAVPEERKESVQPGNTVISDGMYVDEITGEYIRKATPEEIAAQEAKPRNGLDDIIDRRKVERAQEQTAAATAQTAVEAEQAAAQQAQDEYNVAVDEMVRNNPDQYSQIRSMQKAGEPLDIIQGIVRAKAEERAAKGKAKEVPEEVAAPGIQPVENAEAISPDAPMQKEIPQVIPKIESETETVPSEKPVDNKSTGIYHGNKYLNIRRDRITAEDTPALASLLGAGIRLPEGKKLAEITDLFDGIRVYAPRKGWAKPYDENANAQEDRIADNYAQLLHDYHDFGGNEGEHSFTFSDVLEKAREELQELIDNRHLTRDELRAQKAERDRYGGYTADEARQMEEEYYGSLGEEGFTERDIESVRRGEYTADELRRIQREIQSVVQGELTEEIPRMEGESEEDVVAFFSDLAEKAGKPPATKPLDSKADLTTAITDLTDSATGETIAAGTPHYVLPDGRIFSEQSYKNLRNRGAALYATRKVRPVEAGVTRKQVQDAFPKSRVSRNRNGDFVVEEPNGNSFLVKNVEEISPDERAFEIVYGRKMEKDEVIAGEYEGKTDTISITRAGDEWTLRHESYHRLVKRGFLSALERGAVKRAAAKDIGKETAAVTKEDEAAWVEKALRERAEQRAGLAGKAVQRLRDFIDGLVNLHHVTARGVVRAMESGEAGTRLSADSVNERFNRDIEEMARKGRVGKLYLNLGKPGPVLSRFMPKHTIRMGVGKIHLILKDHPDIGLKRNFPDLPRKINDPVAILKSKTDMNSIVILIGDVDGKGKPVVTPVHVGVTDRWNKTRQTNILASVFGAKVSKFINQMNKQPDSLLYYNNKKGLELCSGAAGSNSLMDETSPLTLGSDSLAENKVRNLVSKLQQTWNSVKRNREDQDEEPLYSVRRREETEKAKSEITNNVIDTLKGMRDYFSKLPGKEDLSIIDNTISLPKLWDNIPALKRMVDAATDISDNKYKYQGQIFGDEDDHWAHMRPLADLRKKNPKEFKKLGEYVLKRDINNWRYRVIQEKGGWWVVNPAGMPVERFDSEADAWARTITREAEDMRRILKRDGTREYSDAAADALIHWRQMSFNSYEMLHSSAEEMIREAREKGEPEPEVTVRGADGKPTQISLKVAMAAMGDLRGSFFPRMRMSGRYVVIGKKEGDNPRMKYFLTKIMAGKYKSSLERKGYNARVEKAKGLSQDVYSGLGGTMKTEAVMQAAINRMSKEDRTTGIGDFGYGPERKRNGDLVLQGRKRERDAAVFKKNGGNVHPMGGNTYAWVFHEANRDLEDRIVQDLLEAGAIPNQTPTLLYQKFTEEVADVLRESGALAHRIKRNKATGKDVWLDYEEDPLKAMAMYGNAIAGAAAKHDAAKEMYRAITGKDISWAEWKERNPGGKYEAYKRFTLDRGIDPEEQQRAFETALDYFEDILRNEEAVERIFGMAKGVASMMFLSGRVSTAVWNQTSLFTSSPANISARADVTLRTAMRHIGIAGKEYGLYLIGKLDPEKGKLYKEIEKRGWDTAQFSEDLVRTLRNEAGNFVSKIMDLGMWMQTHTEMINRAVTIAATYRAIKEKHNGPWTPEMEAAALKKGKEVSDAANAVYGKTNLPMWARGSGLGGMAFRSWDTFKTYPWNYLLQMGKYAREEKQQKIAALWMAMSGGLIGGVDLVIPLAVFLAAINFFVDYDPDEELYNWINEHCGRFLETFARFGVAGLLGVSAKGSLDTGIAKVIPDPKALSINFKENKLGMIGNFLDMIGAPGSVVKNELKAIDYLRRGNMAKAAENAFPVAIGAQFRALREATEGQTTRSGTPKYYGNEKVKSTIPEAVVRAFGFNPVRLAEISEIKFSEMKIESMYKEWKARIYSRIKANRMAERTEKNEAEYEKLMDEVRAFNESCPPGVGRITRLGIRAAIRRTQKPPKRERERARTMYEGRERAGAYRQ